MGVQVVAPHRAWPIWAFGGLAWAHACCVHAVPWHRSVVRGAGKTCWVEPQDDSRTTSGLACHVMPCYLGWLSGWHSWLEPRLARLAGLFWAEHGCHGWRPHRTWARLAQAPQRTTLRGVPRGEDRGACPHPPHVHRAPASPVIPAIYIPVKAFVVDALITTPAFPGVAVPSLLLLLLAA